MIKFIYRNWIYLLGLILVVGVCAGLEGFLSVFMMKSIDAAIQGNMESFYREVVRLTVVALLLIPTTIILSFAKGFYKKKSLVSLKYYYVTGVFNKNINEFLRDNNSKYISTMINDINTIENNYIEGIYEVVRNLIVFIVGIIVIGVVSPTTLGVVASIGVLNTLISILLSKPIEKHLTERSEIYERYTSYVKEVLGAFHIIKSTNLENKVNKDFQYRSHSLQYKGYVIDKIYTYICSFQDLSMSLATYIVFGVTVFIAIKGKLTIGGAILIITNIQKIIEPLTSVGEWVPLIKASKKIFEKVDDTLKNKNYYQEKVVLKEFSDSIILENVSFCYDAIVIFKDINLSIKKGGKYLVLGPSGGGKSTFLKLLRKYHLPQSGNILIDGINLGDITKVSYFEQISNIEQEIFLFEDTIRNNITLCNDYTGEEIDIAIEKAGLKEFIEGLPQGINSIIYDNGKNVSGGEKSRIAIARGLLHGANIILIDEAFASLDTKVAREIENTILGLEGITVINVSHVVFEETRVKYNSIFIVKNKGIYES